MKTVEVPLLGLCRPKQWPTLSLTDLVPAGFPVYGANGPIGFADRYTHENPVLLIGCRGSCGTLHITPPKVYANGNAMALDDLDQTRVDLRYLYFYFHYRGFADVVSGSSQPQITRQGLSRVAVPLPSGANSLAEQQRIADILDKADGIRRKRKEAIALTEELLRSAFLEMFGDPVTNPKCWPVKPLFDFCSPKQWPTIAASELSGSGNPVFGANGIIGYHSEMNHADPTVLITCRGATCGTINVCLPNSYVTGNSMALDDPDARIITREYLEWALRLRGLDDTITGSAQPQITRQSLQKVALPVPPVEQHRAFERLVQSNGDMRSGLERARAEAEDLFNSLMISAFSGALEAPR